MKHNVVVSSNKNEEKKKRVEPSPWEIGENTHSFVNQRKNVIKRSHVVGIYSCKMGQTQHMTQDNKNKTMILYT